ncbi:MAG: CheY-like chemotaxis protein [Alteromonadaceae bacterium]|jgi:CheY-like chemotaxis protein
MIQKPHEILIVDDEKSINNMIQQTLADFNIPRMSGLELCSKVRNELQFKHLPLF